MDSSRRKFIYAAGAAAALGGIIESGCNKEQRRLVVLLHGMMILDFRGLTIKAFMPKVPFPCPKPVGQGQPPQGQPPQGQPPQGQPQPMHAEHDEPCAPSAAADILQYGHDYCITPDSKVAHEINLCGKTPVMAQFMLTGVNANRNKPVCLSDQHIVLRDTCPEDLCVNPYKIVAYMELPFPNKVIPLRQAHAKGNGYITGGDDAATYKAQPKSIPLVYAMVYDLCSGEKPVISGMDGKPLWSQSSLKDHVHVHAEPRNTEAAYHFGHLTDAFFKPLKLTIADACEVKQDPPDGSAVGVPDVELYGLPGAPANVYACPKGGDPGNCGSVVLDDGGGGG